MRYAEFKSVNDHGMDLPAFVAPDEVVIVAQGLHTDGSNMQSIVCNIVLRHGAGLVVYGSALEVVTALTEARRVH